jgi:lipoyl-dependent peroxiredoxin
LLAAAHAGCFTGAAAAILTQKNIALTSLHSGAVFTIKDMSITKIHLYITGVVPDIDAEGFAANTKVGEKNCLISKILVIPIISVTHFVN